MIDLLLILFFAFTLSVLWYFCAYLYGGYMTDKLRQELFEIRDDLFLEAEKGNIPFDSKVYGMTRSTLNGMIRFAHRITLLRLFFFKLSQDVSSKETVSGYAKKMDSFLGLVTKEQQQLIMDSMFRMHLTILKHIVWSSLLLAPIALVLKFIFKCFGKFRMLFNLTKRYQNEFNYLDAEANLIGEKRISY